MTQKLLRIALSLMLLPPAAQCLAADDFQPGIAGNVVTKAAALYRCSSAAEGTVYTDDPARDGIKRSNCERLDLPSADEPTEGANTPSVTSAQEGPQLRGRGLKAAPQSGGASALAERLKERLKAGGAMPLPKPDL